MPSPRFWNTIIGVPTNWLRTWKLYLQTTCIESFQSAGTRFTEPSTILLP